MDARSGYRLTLRIALGFVICLMIPGLASYIHVVTGGAAPGKLSASGLERALAHSRRFPVSAKMQRVPYGRSWDYVCSFSPRPSRPRARLQFGVIVDSTRWLRVSGMVPAGTPVPAPE